MKRYNIIDVIADVSKGKLSLVDKEVSNNRYSICKTCDARNKWLNVCTVCGCFIKAKTKLEKASCPMGLW